MMESQRDNAMIECANLRIENKALKAAAATRPDDPQPAST